MKRVLFNYHQIKICKKEGKRVRVQIWIKNMKTMNCKYYLLANYYGRTMKNMRKVKKNDEKPIRSSYENIYKED